MPQDPEGGLSVHAAACFDFTSSFIIHPSTFAAQRPAALLAKAFGVGWNPPVSAITSAVLMRPNETEISHGRVSWQTHWTYFGMGQSASSIG